MPPTSFLLQERIQNEPESVQNWKGKEEKSILKSYGKNIYTLDLYKGLPTNAIFFLDIYPSVLQHPKVSMYSANVRVEHYTHVGRSQDGLDIFL